MTWHTITKQETFNYRFLYQQRDLDKFRQNKDVTGDVAKKLLDDDTIEALVKIDKTAQSKAAFASDTWRALRMLKENMRST